MFAQKIKSITCKGLQPTVDIEVNNNDHIFYGNGIATSNSHSYSYAYNSYLTAYCKANYPLEFFCAYLYYADEKPKPLTEVYELINNAKSFDIYIQPPSIKVGNKKFDIIKDYIYYGLSDIKNVGKAELEKMDLETISKINWDQFLIYHSRSINKRTKESLISSGAMDYMGISRRQMLFNINAIDSLTDKELVWLQVNYSGGTFANALEQLFKAGVGKTAGCKTMPRLKKIGDLINYIKTTPYDLNDYSHEVANAEKALLGTCLTRSHIEESNQKYMANCTCEQFNNGFNTNVGTIIMAVEISSIRMTKTKKGTDPGKDMAFLEISDETGCCNSIVLFPDNWEQNKDTCNIGNTVIIMGKRSKDKNSLIVSEILQI